MLIDGLRYQHVFEGGALAADFERTVVITPLVFVVEVSEQRLHRRVRVHHLLRQYEYPTFIQAFEDAADHRFAFRDRQELQRVIQYHHRCVRQPDLEYVALDDLDWRALRGALALFANDSAAALDHCGGIVYGDDTAAR